MVSKVLSRCLLGALALWGVPSAFAAVVTVTQVAAPAAAPVVATNVTATGPSAGPVRPPTRPPTRS